MKPTARHTILAALLIGLPLLQAATNQNRTSACAVTGPGCADQAPAAERSRGQNCGPTCGTASPCGLNSALTDDQRPHFDAATLSAFHDQLAEERMAARIYRAFAERYPAVRPFQNIPRAEDRHAASVATLLACADPTFSPSAMITNPTYSTLGDDLIERGSTSEVEALRVGAYIEEKDILDLQALLGRLDHDGAKAIVAQLEQGSHHHLAAFVRNLSRHGVTYEPQLLSTEAYAEIVFGNS
ncbi:DUF2202 domain-containing protein [Actomonas aquatica]|uniref:DUF2202 domain-containing protein n=1 Tax=Actomonas aquatica TaxID=2866162 RepID=A0ABZ1C4G8_9BACT|nr:DUF2202 domain-containing protein [Opitutus sp. WL0086]WRQ86341.1 DUF2202 domain-containing protein [Opitutus sp. WL0086]